MKRTTLLAAWTVCLFATVHSAGAAELNANHQRQISALHETLLKLPTLFRQKKFEEYGTLIDDVDSQIQDLRAAAESDPSLASHIVTLESRVEAAHRLLQTSLDVAAATAKAKGPPKGETEPVVPPTEIVSFTKDVAPILVGKCARCHINRSSGGFSLATYGALMRGTNDGTVFNPGKGVGSILVESLQSGAMPKGASRLRDLEIVAIVRWIDQGARFDGPDEKMPLADIVSAAASGTPVTTTPPPTTPPPSTVATTPTKPLMPTSATTTTPPASPPTQKVSFMADIAPVINANCTECHSGRRPAGRYNMETFRRVMGNGEFSKPVVTPGDPTGSAMIKKLRGTAEMGRRMPANRPPLSDEVIKKFEAWIAAGAPFDGEDPNESIDFLLKVIMAQKMTHEELAAYRADIAKKDWKLTMPGVTAANIDGKDFLVLSNVLPARMVEIGELLDAQRAKVAKILNIPEDRPITKGRATIYVFDKRFEYSEFGQMVEERSIPKELNGHYFFNIVEGYAALAAPPDDTDENFRLIAAEQIASLYVAQAGKKVPMWFSSGTGRVVASMVEPKAPLIKTWDANIGSAAFTSAKTTEFLTAKQLDAASSELSYGFVKFLMSAPGGRFSSVIEALKKEVPLDRALQQYYGGDSLKLAKAWLSGAR